MERKYSIDVTVNYAIGSSPGEPDEKDYNVHSALPLADVGEAILDVMTRETEATSFVFVIA